MQSRDDLIVSLIASGRLRVDAASGLVYAPRSNTPTKPVGARTKKGYLRLCMNVGGKQVHFMVHRIVWVSVHGPVAEGWEVDHGNRKKTDNRIGNLEAVPGSENMRRATEAGARGTSSRRCRPMSDICPECHQPLILTPSGWLSCPAGHGKLVPPGQALTPAAKRAADQHLRAWRKKLGEVFPAKDSTE